MSARKSLELQLDLLDRLPSSDRGDELSFPEGGNAGTDCAIGASAGSGQPPSLSDRAKASPVPAKTNACIKHAFAGQDAIANCPVDTPEPPIPPSTGLVPRKRGRPRGIRNKRSLDKSTRSTAPGLVADQVQTWTRTGDGGVPSVKFLNVVEVAARYSISVSTIWRWLKTNPNFPKPVHPSNGATRWRVADLDAFDDTLGAHYRPQIPDDISTADLAGQPRAKPSQRAWDGGGTRKRHGR